MLHGVETALDTANFDLLGSVELTELLLLLVDLFRGAGALLTDQKVAITVVLNSPLLNCIDLNIFCTDVVLEL